MNESLKDCVYIFFFFKNLLLLFSFQKKIFFFLIYSLGDSKTIEKCSTIYCAARSKSANTL
jgi:hypothetical protein